MIISLDYAKKHLLVEHDEDDAYITDLIGVAEAEICQLINRDSFEEVLNEEGEIPKPLQHASAMLVAKLYAYREGDSPSRTREVPFTIAALIAPYRYEK